MLHSDQMRKTAQVSDEIKDTQVERAPFEAVVKKLLAGTPITKPEVSAKISTLTRKRPFTKRILS